MKQITDFRGLPMDAVVGIQHDHKYQRSLVALTYALVCGKRKDIDRVFISKHGVHVEKWNPIDIVREDGGELLLFDSLQEALIWLNEGTPF